MHRRGTLCAALLLGCLPVCAATPPSEDDLLYELSLPAGQRVGYAIEFAVTNPGRLEVITEWAGNRVLSFRLEEVGAPQETFQRSGPSPQNLAIEVQNPGDTPRYYRLQISGLAQREGASGTVTVRRPQPLPPPPPRLDELAPAQAPEVRLFPLPAGTPQAWRRFSEAADRFADAVAQDPRGDSCRWQSGLAEYLTRRRDALIAGEPPPTEETLQAITSIVEVVHRVDELRTSTDPTLAGPPPDDPRERRFWSRARAERIRPVESELDSLLAGIERGHAPDLSASAWPFRLVSCVIGSERHFEERVRVGADRAVNFDLVQAQWGRLLEATDLLDFLTRLPHATDRPAGSVPPAPIVADH